jgi:hypothetical protein
VRTDDNEIKKALVTLCIEKVLVEMGKPVLEEVTRRLDRNYKCYIPDCYEHPEFLKSILKELYGDSHNVIVDSIRKYLDEFRYEESIQRFVQVLAS